jgi:hypothetical protein
MAWCERGQRKYFYRSKRINGKPRRLYLGSGAAGERAARQDEQRRRERRAADAAWEAELAELREIDALVERFCRMTDLLLAAALMAANYHKHGGEWRLSRGHAKRSNRPEKRPEGPGRD